jgi:ActR/RegA family two-component response regulator
MTPDLERPRVLIIDEEPLMRWFLSEIASEAGYRATQLSTIDEALDLLHESTDPVAVVLASCPHTFADLPWVAAMRQLRPRCRLALMTSFPTPGFLEQALIAGASDVLNKPADASDVASLFARVNTAAEAPQSSLTFSFEIPKSLQRERKQLHDELSRIAAERGSVGDAAQQVEQMLQAHGAHEEAFALPPLGLLPLLACGLAWSEMAPAVTMAARLKSSLPSMLEDHEAIVAALRAFERTAERAGRTELAPLARRLIEHAEMEAEVLYPASIVAGKLVEAQLSGRRQGAS